MLEKFKDELNKRLAIATGLKAEAIQSFLTVLERIDNNPTAIKAFILQNDNRLSEVEVDQLIQAEAVDTQNKDYAWLDEYLDSYAKLLAIVKKYSSETIVKPDIYQEIYHYISQVAETRRQKPLKEYDYLLAKFEKNIPRKVYTDNDYLKLSEPELQEKIKFVDNNYLFSLKKPENDAMVARSFLWKAEKENSAPIFIFGVIHRANFDVKDIFGEALDKILDQVQVVFTESDLSTLESVEHFLVKNNIFIMDYECLKIAIGKGKVLKALENTTALKVMAKYVNCHYDNLQVNEPSSQDIDNNSKQYLATATIKSDMHYDNLYEFTSVRNKFWMESLLGKSQASLVVCGEGHVNDDNSLLSLLEAQGYSLTPLMKKAPTPKSEIVKNLASQSKILNSATQNDNAADGYESQQSSDDILPKQRPQ